MTQRKSKETSPLKNQKDEVVVHEGGEQTVAEGISAAAAKAMQGAVLADRALDGSLPAVPSASDAARVFAGIDEARGSDTTVTSLLMKDRDITLHKGDVVVVCSEPGFRRAGMAHPHVRVHESGDLTNEQLAMLRAEPKITVIVVGG